MNAFNQRVSLAVFAVPFVLAAFLPMAAHAQTDGLVQVILEQNEVGHGPTIDDKEIIETASKLLVNREKVPKELVSKLLFARGMAYFRSRELVSAKKDADDLCSMSGTNPDALCFRAVVLLELTHYAEAVAEAKRSLQLNPKDVKAQCVIAAALLAKNDAEGAFLALEDARDIDPKYATTYLLQGMLLRRYDPSECLKAINKFLELAPVVGGPDAECAYYCKGFSLSLLNRPEEAAANLLAAHKINPKVFDTAHELGSVSKPAFS